MSTSESSFSPDYLSKIKELMSDEETNPISQSLPKQLIAMDIEASKDRGLSIGIIGHAGSGAEMLARTQTGRITVLTSTVPDINTDELIGEIYKSAVERHELINLEPIVRIKHKQRNKMTHLRPKKKKRK